MEINIAYNTVGYSNSAASQTDEDNVYELSDDLETIENDAAVKQDDPENVVETATEIDDTYAVVSDVSVVKNVFQKQELPANPKKCSNLRVVIILTFVIAIVSVLLAVSFFTYGQFQSATISEDIQALHNNTAKDIHTLNVKYQDQIKSLTTRIMELEVELNGTVRNEINNAFHSLQMESSAINETLLKVIENTRLSLRGLEEQVLSTRFLTPISSCNDIPENTSGEFWMLRSINGSGSLMKVYCDATLRNCSCDTSGAWMRIAHIDMTDPSHHCPDGFKTINRTEKPLRTCGRPEEFTGECVSSTFPVHGTEYSRVCGRVISYQYGSPNGFAPFLFRVSSQSIDGAYVEGILLTHGTSPRQHIWSFVGALGKNLPMDRNFQVANVCPCMLTNNDGYYLRNITIPPWVGNSYFCDTAKEDTNYNATLLYSDDPLWDGEGCGSNSTCCEFNNPPWFCKQLPQPTTNDIELRLCKAFPIRSEDDTPFELVDIFIK